MTQSSQGRRTGHAAAAGQSGAESRAYHRLVAPMTLGSALRDIRALFARVVRSVRVFRGFGDAAAIELKRVGLVEAKGHRTVLGVGWLVFYWAIFFVVLFLPTWKEEPVVYFPALFALGAAWLIALPQLSNSLARANFSGINFGIG